MNPERLKKAPNISIVGSTSPLGKELRELIEGAEFPVGKLSLLETEEYAGLLQEFAGEIRITQIISPESFADTDIAFFACSPEIMKAFAASGAAIPEVTIDLTQTGREGTLFLNGLTSLSLISPIREPALVAPWSAVSHLAITTVPDSVINPGCSKIERLDNLGG